MITGFSPSYKKIVIGDDEITMPGDKVVKFKRASTATYINKSGVFSVAKIDEPRFEKEGLLIEGQRLTILLNPISPLNGRVPAISIKLIMVLMNLVFHMPKCEQKII
ncbi:hypothetical protein [Escherichia coli]|uniref:hypothetical protein n=1 Tax=Escherichia coli TaxID=562 RepID=UPI003EBA0044